MGKQVLRPDAESLKAKDPDHGNPMIEGAQHFDKGYESDADVFKRLETYPSDKERGNHYVKLNNEMVSRDSKKLHRNKFTKIA